ncbi:hypothetical protein [Cohnella sp. AR92]|uniref:hypothetical protein n=1 Tax=Cohnella sp. AR92 TaxID=648716 RepID=UPI000F8CA0F6|nr:hypothetical protein [Cohnella sp. AR92]RUS42263.1 hypothetical protein ELR57_27000 [Cohnella sp. AR92]
MGVTSIDWSKYGVKDDRGSGNKTSLTSVDWSKYTTPEKESTYNREEMQKIGLDAAGIRSSYERIADGKMELPRPIQPGKEEVKLSAYEKWYDKHIGNSWLGKALGAAQKADRSVSNFKAGAMDTASFGASQGLGRMAINSLESGDKKDLPSLVAAPGSKGDLQEIFDARRESPGYKVGEIAGYIPPGALIERGLASAGKAVGKEIIKGSTKKAIARGAVAGSIDAAAQETGDKLFREGEFDPENVAIGGVAGGTIGGVFSKLGEYAPKMKSAFDGLLKRKQAISPEVEQAASEVLATATPESTIRMGPAERIKTTNDLMTEIGAEVNKRMTPPLDNPNELAKWLQTNLGDDIPLNEVNKLSPDDMRQLAEEVRSGMSKAEVAMKVANEKGHDFRTLLEQYRKAPNEAAAAREAVTLNQDEIPFSIEEPGVGMKPDDYAKAKAEREAQRAARGTDDVTSQVADDLQIFDPADVKDINGFTAYTRDFYRNMEKALGENAKPYIESFNAAKKANVDMQEYWVNRLKNEVVDKLGIEKDSKLSSLVQQYGEKTITLDELKLKAPKDWEKVVEADKWFREAYDNMIDIVNDVRQRIYPNNPDKIVPKREDYYRHFRELDGLEGLKNLFETPANIDPSLAGTSDFTKPRTKFAGFMQRRGLGPYKNDAVGGFLNYLPAASHATHIDPETAKIRSLAEALRGSSPDGSNNTFIEYLDDFANDLAGKTNPFDRAVQKVVSRKVMGLVNWISNRVKSNTILGNAGSAIAQTANIPLGIAHAKQYAVPGFVRTVSAAFKEDAAMAESGFLKERFAQQMYRQFDTNWLTLKNPLHIKKLAEWTMETADKLGTYFVWNSSYAKALADKVADPIAHADDITRKLVAGRGVGETPLFLKSKVGKLIAPFQLEVGNLWHVMGDFAKKKDFTGLAVLFTANWLFNQGMKQVRGSGVTFDPIQATIDAVEGKDMTAEQRAGRIGGEVLSNVPLGQTIASLLFTSADRQKYFGKSDPTRFGSGLPLAKAIEDPLHFVLPGFGGNQIKKATQGVEAMSEGAAYTPKGEMKFPITMSPANVGRLIAFGPNSTPEAQEYYDENRRPLGAKDTEAFKQADDKKQFYDNAMARRELSKIEEEITKVKKSVDLSAAEKEKKIDKLVQQYEQLKTDAGFR